MAIFNGTNANDTVLGGAGDDSITGLGGDDSLSGGDGNDTLIGGAGADFIRGGAGNDSIDGGAVLDRNGYTDGNSLSYSDSTSAINLNLSGISGDGSVGTGTVQDGLGGTDTVANVQFITGSAFDDVLVGSTAAIFETFEGGAGNDSIDGGASSDNRAIYTNASAAVTVDLIAGTATGGDGNDSLSNINQVRGSGFNDTLLGTDRIDRWESFEGRAGDDSIDGRGGQDVVRYDTATTGAVVDLANHTASDGLGGTDALFNIENVYGSAQSDTITGSSDSNTLEGRGGNDVLSGGAGNDSLYGGDGNDIINGNEGNDFIRGNAGNDTIDGGAVLDRINYTDGNSLSYSDATAGINLNLSGITGNGSTGTGTVQDGLGGTDTVMNVNFITGSNQGDVITGSSALIFEQFEGLGGNDTIDGGALHDTLNQTDANRANYSNAAAGGVTVDLQAGTATGAAGTDVLLNITQVRGSASGDSLLGSDRTDYTEHFDGRGGNDTIDGRGGFDVVRYDSLATAGVNVDLVTGIASDGLGGTDTLLNIEGVFGSSFADVLTGGNAANGTVYNDGKSEIFRGGAGNDTIDGGQGYDRVDYTSSTMGVVVTLNGASDGSAIDGIVIAGVTQGVDVLRNIEAVRGSDFADTLTGSDTAVFESFEGRAGADIIDGKGGVDRVEYGTSTVGVNVNLTNTNTIAGGTAADGWGSIDTLLGIENVRGSTFNDTILGSSLDNKLEGQAGNDSLSGAAGNDTLNAGTGIDTVDGGADNDTLLLKGAFGTYQLSRTLTDTVLTNVSTSENITFRNIEQVSFNGDVRSMSEVLNNSLGAFDDSWVGTSGNDSADGLAGNDNLSGLDGNDTLIGGTGNDTLVGGTGNDVYSVDSLGDTVVELDGEGTDTVNVGLAAAGTYSLVGTFIENATVTSGATIAVNLTGNDLDNVLVGNGAANTLIGNGGNDTLNGGAGTDNLNGGAGNDTYVIDVTTDVVNEGAGAGVDTVNVSLLAAGTYLMTPNVENAFVGGNLAVNITGNGSDNLITGNSANNILIGGLGNDTLIAGTGTADVLDGTAGDDQVNVIGNYADYTITRTTTTDTLLVNTMGSGENITIRNIDTVLFADGSKTISDLWQNKATVFGDILLGTSGGETIDGLAGNDTITGLAGNDTLIGGLGSDSLIGGLGDDLYVVDVAGVTGDVIVENPGEGIDTVNVALTVAGTYTLGANIENGTVTSGGTLIVGIIGNALDNLLIGNANANALTGNAGNDTLDGGSGTDTLIGGAGDDTYFINTTTDLVNETATGSGGTDTVNLLFAGAATYTLTANVENATVLGASVSGVNLTGNILANVLTGNGGNNILNGADGNDTIAGNGGTDIVDGGAGTNTLVLSGLASDYVITRPTVSQTVFTESGTQVTASNIQNVTFDDGTVALSDLIAQIGSVGNDTLTGGSGADVLDGAAGNDSVSGMGGDDMLFGGAGNDTITGGTGTDILDGGDGTDTYVYNPGDGDDVIDQNDTVAGVVDTLQLNGVTADQVTFTRGYYSYDDLVVNITQGTGETASVDHVAIVGFFSNDAVSTGTIDRVVVSTGGVIFTQAAMAAQALLDGDGDHIFVGYNLNDTIPGSLANDWIMSGAGNDLVNADQGDDIVFGGSGADVLNGMSGDDLLVGGAGNDTLTGGSGNDTLIGGAGSDTYQFDPTAGHDLLIERPFHLTDAQLQSGIGPMYVMSDGDTPLNNDTDVLKFNGTAESDVRATRTGDDLVLTIISTTASITVQDYFGNGVPTIERVQFAASGASWSTTAIRAKVLQASSGDDQLTGYLSGDKISGLGGNDTIDGREGNDVLNGGAGNDVLTGGTGSDRFVFDVAPDALTSTDTITDFQSGVDTIALSAAVFSGLGPVGTRVGLTDNLTYDTGSGELAYDADGVGGAAAVTIVVLGIGSHPPALGTDFLIIA
jgi:Ca2+-binding RTX toxin-like protein